MKKILLVASLLAPTLIFAQQSGSDANIVQQQTNIVVPAVILPYVNPHPHAGNGFVRKANLPYKLDTIGYTYYDLQTNASIGNRVLVHNDGRVSVAWTYSPDGTSEFPLRGTAYNHFNNVSWGNHPLSRIENERLGWPSIGLLPGGNEYVIAHFATTGGLNVITNNAIGGNTWTTGPRVL